MNKRILLILIIFLLTGCFDHQELNDIAILSATEINKINNTYILNAEIINPQSPDKTTDAEAPFIIYTGTGPTIQEAYRQIKLSQPRYIYPDHLRIIIINENIAKENIDEILDFYLRNPQSRTEFNILIGQNENILNPTTPIDNISATSILESLKTSSNYLGITNLVNLNTLADISLNPNTEIVLPSIKLENIKEASDTLENTKQTKIDSTYKLASLAIFKDNKLKGYLTDKESITYNTIKNNLKNTIITYHCNTSEYMSLEVISNKSKITTKNGKIYINIKEETTINESTCNIKLNNQNKINKLEKDISNYIKNTTINNINNIRNKYNSDIFGLLDIIYKHDYNTYLKVKDNWYNDTFKNIPIEVNVNIKIISKGNVMEGINEKN